MFTWLHDSWNAFPTYAILDHTMTVRAKPWPYSSNGNSNSCDGTNDTIDNWNGGDANDFIAQLIEECGNLCEPCNHLQKLLKQENLVKNLLHKGGIRCEILKGGKINIGDKIEV